MRRWLVCLGVAALLGVAGFIAWPLPGGLCAYGSLGSLRILDREGGLLREVNAAEEGRSRPLGGNELPPVVVSAFLAAEDAGFFHHPGLSPSSTARALWRNVRAGRAVAGGSTLTQQLARALVPRPRTLVGKLQEALWALRLEAHLTKREILTQYLNRVPLGNGAFGIEVASETYFGRHAAHLSVAQAALLASIPKGPARYNPYRDPPRLQQRKSWVLHRMQQLGWLDEAAHARAEQEPLDLGIHRAAFRAPHLAELVLRHRAEWGLADAAEIRTTLDPTLQEDAETAILGELQGLAGRHVTSAAALVVDNATGEVLAYQGSADFFDDASFGQNDGVQMLRQPGSALKPFVYAEAFSRGFTAASILADTEVSFAGPKGAYAPQNYDRIRHGPVRARQALANSLNVPAVRLAEAVGPANLLRTLRAAGLDSLREEAGHYGLGLALGDGEVSLAELSRAYVGLARGGVMHPLRFVLQAKRADGSEMALQRGAPPRRFVDATSAALVTDILADNGAREEAFGAENALRFGFAVAAKTGTSKGYSDNWTVGYTRQRTVGVWAGNFDGSPMLQVSGVTGAGPIFHRLMLQAMKRLPLLPLDGQVSMQEARVCPLSGELAGASCPSSVREVFAPGTVPTATCGVHAHASGPSLGNPRSWKGGALSPEVARVTCWAPAYQAWARAHGLGGPEESQALCKGDAAAGASLQQAEAPRIVRPAAGDEYLLLADLPRQDQAIPVEVEAGALARPLTLELDGARIASIQPPYHGRLPVTLGAHTLTLRSLGEGGSSSSVFFQVRAEH